MSVCDPTTGMHHLFLIIAYPGCSIFLPQPNIPFNEFWNDCGIEPLSDLLERKGTEIAALILEPCCVRCWRCRISLFANLFSESASTL